MTSAPEEGLPVIIPIRRNDRVLVFATMAAIAALLVTMGGLAQIPLGIVALALVMLAIGVVGVYAEIRSSYLRLTADGLEVAATRTGESDRSYQILSLEILGLSRSVPAMLLFAKGPGPSLVFLRFKSVYLAAIDRWLSSVEGRIRVERY